MTAARHSSHPRTWDPVVKSAWSNGESILAKSNGGDSNWQMKRPGSNDSSVPMNKSRAQILVSSPNKEDQESLEEVLIPGLEHPRTWNILTVPRDGLNNTLPSQACILENGSNCGNSEQNVHSKDRDGGEGPPVARVQLQPQPAVTSSQ
ncbi:uncharacterized protein [Globicephala melas]|uniref:uncharacterized protein isoform X2 n=1 Tax=Globicephala melas TaxID=9731 RepID=UPI003873A182